MELSEVLIIEPETGKQNAALESLYEKLFPMVAQWVSRRGGSLEDTKDIFHDALIIYLEMQAHDAGTIHSSEKAYILGIAKHLWIRKYNASRTSISLNQLESTIAIPEDFYPTVDNKRLLRFLELAGQKCLYLLRAFYYQKLPVKKLAKMLGYSSEHSASVQKYKCLEKVRQSVKEKSLGYEDFVE